MTLAPAPRFEIGRVISRMVGVITRNFLVLAMLSLLLSGLPSFLVALATQIRLPVDLDVRSGEISALPLFNLLIAALLQAALIHGTVSDLNGRKPTFEDCLSTAIREVLPLIGISICTTIAVVFGLVFLIVPGVILALAFCVSAPACVVERLGVFAAMRRSRELTRNHRGALLLLFVLYWVGLGVLTAVTAPLFALGALMSAGMADLSASLVVRPVLQAAGALIGAAGVASIYFELRTIKEGVGVEALAAAFD